MLFIHSPNVRQKAFGVLLLAGAIGIFTLVYRAMDWQSFTFWYAVFVLVMVLYGALMLLVKKSDAPAPQLPDSTRWRGPNSFSIGERVANAVSSFALVVWGTYGLYRGDIPMPMKFGTDHVTGVAAWLLYGAMLCAAANFVAEVVDHYDRRNNELAYANFSAATKWLGWTFFLAAAVQNILQVAI